MSDLKWLRQHHGILVPEIADELGLDDTGYLRFEAGTGASRLDHLKLDYKRLLVAKACETINDRKRHG